MALGYLKAFGKGLWRGGEPKATRARENEAVRTLPHTRPPTEVQGNGPETLHPRRLGNSLAAKLGELAHLAEVELLQRSSHLTGNALLCIPQPPKVSETLSPNAAKEGPRKPRTLQAVTP